MLKLRCALVVAMTMAGGTAAADKIVLEAYTGPRPADAEKILSPLLDELRHQHFTFGADNVGRQFDADVSRPATTLQGLPRDFPAQVDNGHRAYVSGNFIEAEKILGPLIESAHQNSGAFAADSAPRDALLKALIDLALSQQRKGDPAAAKETFEEVVRSFPGATVSRALYGPDAFTLFDTVQRGLHAGSMGTLHVKVGNAAIYINEKLEGVGDVTKQVVAGEYRVFAQTMSKDLSRVHRVRVAGGGEFEIKIDPNLDTAIHTGPQWTGLTFSTAGDREKYEGAAAAAFARGLHAESVAIVGIDQVRGHAAIVGVLVDLEKGRDIRRASVPADAASTSGVRSLASFLAGGPAGPEVVVADIPETKPDAKPDDGTPDGTKPDEDNSHRDDHPRGDRGGGLWGGYKYIVGGLGAGALVTGGVLLVLDGRCQTPAPMGMQCTDVYSTATPAYIAIGGGVVLAAVTVVLWLHGSGSSPPARAAYIVPTSGGAVAGFSSTF